MANLSYCDYYYSFRVYLLLGSAHFALMDGMSHNMDGDISIITQFVGNTVFGSAHSTFSLLIIMVNSMSCNMRQINDNTICC